MFFKYLVIGLFIGLFVYSAVRPFSSIYAKLFVLIGSILGLVSVIDSKYMNMVAEMLGIYGGGKDLFLYVSLVTVFFFICYSWEKFKDIERKIAVIVKAITLKGPAE